jgi:hypothetical protein
MRPIHTGLVPALFLILGMHPDVSAAAEAQVSGLVSDENGVPVASVQVDFRSASSGQAETAYTDSGGAFRLSGLPPGRYLLTLSKSGYFLLADQQVKLDEGLNEISFLLQHETEIHEQIEVRSAPNPVQPGEPDHQEILVAREIRDVPISSSHDLQSALPVLPAVVRDNSGDIHIAGARVGESQIFLDGFEIGDPVSGGLTTRVNVDAVRDVEVDAGRYGVQYGRGGGGVLMLDTTVGDDKFRPGMTNFVPGVVLQQGLHLGNWFPRFTFSGPIRRGQAWFSEALSLQHSFKLVPELPSNANTATQWAGDNLFRTQINLTPHNLLQGSFLYNRQDDSHLGLGPFAPLSTATDLRSQRSFVSLKDQTWTRDLVFDFGVAADWGSQNSLPMGPGPFIVQPSATAGDYFESLRQRGRRWQVVAGITAPSRNWHGLHHLQAGVHLERISWTHEATRSPIDIERQDGTLIQQTTFSGPASFQLSDTQTGLYVQDSWTVLRPLIIQAGVRRDGDRFGHHALMSPRIAANFLPWRDERAKFTVAWGVYYQPILLGTVGPSFDQQRLDTFYDPSGKTIVLGPVTSLFSLPPGGLKLPRFDTTSLEWEQKIRQNIYAGADFTFRGEHEGLAYELQPSAEDLRSLVLRNNRRDRYRALQFSLRDTFGGKAELSAVYIHSSARSNEALDYSPTTLVFAPQQPGALPWDVPNRVILTGSAPTPIWGLFLSCFVESRTGFPFGIINQEQQLLGPPDSRRYPDYLSINLGIEKHFRLLSRVWAVRLAIVDATRHANPDSVINNIDSPRFLQFAGGQRRAFSGRIRLVG